MSVHHHVSTYGGYTIDWLTICRDKSENELRARKWKALLYGTPWLYAFAIAAAATYLVTPAQVPMTVYCWAAFGELGSLADTIGGIIAVVCYIIMTALVFLSMVALIRVRLEFGCYSCLFYCPVIPHNSSLVSIECPIVCLSK